MPRLSAVGISGIHAGEDVKLPTTRCYLTFESSRATKWRHDEPDAKQNARRTPRYRCKYCRTIDNACGANWQETKW